MPSIDIRPLRDDLPFGARIRGVCEKILRDPLVRQQLNEVFEDRGLLIFEDVEPSIPMQLAISNVFGTLKDHPIKLVQRVDEDTMPGVIEIRHDAKSTILEVDGKVRVNWLPWHFDHCYNNELNRAGVLRAVETPPEGGMTGFADGIALYQAISPELRDQIEGHNILYRFEPDSLIHFGRPKSFRVIRSDPSEVVEFAKTLPRAIHPAVWTRQSGEKVLHLSPWMSV